MADEKEGVNTEQVFIGAPKQDKTAGAVATGDVLSDIPETYDDAVKAIEAMDTTSGYITSDGVAFSADMSTEGLQDWALGIVRTVMTEYTATVAFSFMQLCVSAFKQALGEAYVDGDDGGLHAKFGPHMAPNRSWGIRMEDGDRAIILLIPDGQVSAMDEIDFAADSAVALPITVTANDDGTGENVHMYIKYADGTTDAEPVSSKVSTTAKKAA